MKNLNGWQRIGLAVFVIWSLVASAVLWADFHNSLAGVFKLQLRGCQARYDSAPKDYGLAAYQRCQQEADDKFQAEWERATREFWQFIPFVITIPALLVRGLISLLIVIVRWIRKGFA